MNIREAAHISPEIYIDYTNDHKNIQGLSPPLMDSLETWLQKMIHEDIQLGSFLCQKKYLYNPNEWLKVFIPPERLSPNDCHAVSIFELLIQLAQTQRDLRKNRILNSDKNLLQLTLNNLATRDQNFELKIVKPNPPSILTTEKRRQLIAAAIINNTVDDKSLAKILKITPGSVKGLFYAMQQRIQEYTEKTMTRREIIEHIINHQELDLDI